eukprot:5782055-Prymnesium_polylepis.1
MQQRKDAETELARKQSQVDRLGGHVANAMRESARLAAQTAKLRQALAPATGGAIQAPVDH